MTIRPDEDEWHATMLEVGYIWCRPHEEYHRPPECAIDQQGNPVPWWTSSENQMTRPRLLDLFGGCGGAAKGYAMAGFDVTSVDNRRTPHWGDLRVMDWERALDTLPLEQFAAIHASPPCQHYTLMNHSAREDYPDLVGPVRERCQSTGLPYVIENVPGAPLRKDLLLCGEQFGLRVIRHRIFELGGWTTLQLPHVRHRDRTIGWRHGEYHPGYYFQVHGTGGSRGSARHWQHAMGIHWTDDKAELAEAIPPAYTAFIGERLLGYVAQNPLSSEHATTADRG